MTPSLRSSTLLFALALTACADKAASTDDTTPATSTTDEPATGTTAAPATTTSDPATTAESEPATTPDPATTTTHGHDTDDTSTTTPDPTTTTDSSTTSASACAAEAQGECGACMADACCDALVACEGDPDCVACVVDNVSDACESDVETHDRVDAYLACKGGACQQPCIGETTGTCEEALAELEPDACLGCLETHCCDEIAACHGNEVCWNGCFLVHNDEVCHSDPDGHALYHALKQCAGACQSECA